MLKSFKYFVSLSWKATIIFCGPPSKGWILGIEETHSPLCSWWEFFIATTFSFSSSPISLSTILSIWMIPSRFKVRFDLHCSHRKMILSVGSCSFILSFSSIKLERKVWEETFVFIVSLLEWRKDLCLYYMIILRELTLTWWMAVFVWKWSWNFQYWSESKYSYYAIYRHSYHIGDNKFEQIRTCLNPFKVYHYKSVWSLKYKIIDSGFVSLLSCTLSHI